MSTVAAGKPCPVCNNRRKHRDGCEIAERDATIERQREIISRLEAVQWGQDEAVAAERARCAGIAREEMGKHSYFRPDEVATHIACERIAERIREGK